MSILCMVILHVSVQGKSVIQNHLSGEIYHKKSYLTFVSLNCCSLRSNSKRISFLAIIEEHHPDIVCGCESHLNNTYHTSEIFPASYNVYRKDCVEGGGVFICVRKSLVAPHLSMSKLSLCESSCQPYLLILPSSKL